MSNWFIKTDSGEHGPVTAQQLRQLAAASRITPNTSVRRDEDTAWHLASKIKGLNFASHDADNATPSTVTVTEVAAETKPCPFCAEAINVNAVKCRHCGEFLTEQAAMQAAANSQPSQPPTINRVSPYAPTAIPQQNKHNRLVHICDKQKMVIWAMLIGLILEVPILLFTGLVPLLGVPLALAYLAFRTTVAMQLGLAVYREGIVGVFLALLTIIPFFGLIFLVVINSRATSVLKSGGVSVGLMGANRTQAEHAQNNAVQRSGVNVV